MPPALCRGGGPRRARKPGPRSSPGVLPRSEFEWTAPGFGAFIRKVHDKYPDKLILQNRGRFFFDPRHPQYAYNARGAIDFVLFPPGQTQYLVIRAVDASANANEDTNTVMLTATP